MKENPVVKSDAVARDMIQAALNAAKSTQNERYSMEAEYGIADLNPMAEWLNQIYDAMFVFQKFNSGTSKVADALCELRDYMTPQEIKAFGTPAEVMQNWITLVLRHKP